MCRSHIFEEKNVQRWPKKLALGCAIPPRGQEVGSGNLGHTFLPISVFCKMKMHQSVAERGQPSIEKFVQGRSEVLQIDGS